MRALGPKQLFGLMVKECGDPRYATVFTPRGERSAALLNNTTVFYTTLNT